MTVSDRIPTQPTPTQTRSIELEEKTISDRQSTLFDLDQYECDRLVQWGWLDPAEKLGSNQNLLPNSQSPQLGSNKNLLPNSESPQLGSNKTLLPNSPVREQTKTLLPNLEIVKVQGRSYRLTPSKKTKLLPKERSWYDIKTQKGHQYLYLRWREDKTQKSRCLGRIDALEYSE